MDEGTAMYKLFETEKDLPLGARQVPLNEDGYKLQSDWYLLQFDETIVSFIKEPQLLLINHH